MIEIEEARRLVLEHISPLPGESVALRAALGRVLAEDVASPEDVPAFDGSAMDGFAVRAADTRGAQPDSPVRLRVVAESRAGHPATSSLTAGQAIAVSTGAVIPTGADAVVRVEETRSGDGLVEVLCEVEAHHDMRHAGEDIRGGDSVLLSGVRLGPAELGVLASSARSTVICHRRPTVWILTTGDELIEPEEPLRPGAVRNSNAYSIPALAERAGAEVIGVTAVPDNPEVTRAAIARTLESDVTVICGGVSVGAHDHVKQALGDLGVREIFWGVALKPGKPTWFGRHPGGLVFGLPGNPVSAMVTFALLVRPALHALSGAQPERRRTTARLDRDYEKSPGRAHAVRCRLQLREDGWHARPAERQGSHVLTSMLGADALAIIPTASGDVRAGERVEIELLGDG
ncbi:MAG TPA: gephyrin-like molybdotransferase Glp [Solirubrobacteraceae bacterium]|nr:gephyrin-like molybdotransferase Glp [Solirubrobacteraceae bacterium]